MLGRFTNRGKRELVSLVRRLLYERRERAYAARFRELEMGSVPWLIAAERHYGGMVKEVPRQRVSPVDPRSVIELKRGGMIGGDRMSARYHNYAPKYSQYLQPLVRKGRGSITLIEVGVLKGTGLAMWSDMFPTGRILGLDIDLQHVRSNMNSLRERGAFPSDNLELHEFDQFKDNRNYIGGILGEDRVTVYIDDGFHSEETVLASLHSVFPYLDDEFVCVVEDNRTVATRIAAEFPQVKIDSAGALTILTPCVPMMSETRSPWKV